MYKIEIVSITHSKTCFKFCDPKDEVHFMIPMSFLSCSSWCIVIGSHVIFSVWFKPILLSSSGTKFCSNIGINILWSSKSCFWFYWACRKSSGLVIGILVTDFSFALYWACICKYLDKWMLSVWGPSSVMSPKGKNCQLVPSSLIRCYCWSRFWRRLPWIGTAISPTQI